MNHVLTHSTLQGEGDASKRQYNARTHAFCLSADSVEDCEDTAYCYNSIRDEDDGLGIFEISAVGRRQRSDLSGGGEKML